MAGIMWVEKYRPKTVAEVIGNEEAKTSFINWLRKWRHGNKAALLYGPAGIGKTALVHAAAHYLNYNVIEMNASDVRTKEAIMKVAGPASSLDSLDKSFLGSRGTLLLIDEVDGVFGREDRGGVGAILEIIRESSVPVILTANDPDHPRLSLIRVACHMIRFRRVRIPLTVMLLRRICQTEGVSAEDEALTIIAKNSQGDVRSAINDLQVLCEGKNILRKDDIRYVPIRNRGLDIHDTLKGIFSAKSFMEARRALNNSLIDYDTLLLSIHDNLPLQYTDPEKLATAYDALSKADVYRGRVKHTQNQRLLSYFLEQLVRSAAVAPEDFRPINHVFPPTKRLVLKRTRSERILLNRMCAKIGAKCHVSRRVAKLGFLPFLKVIFKVPKRASQIEAWFSLDKEMVDYLMEKG